jgi:hypothetical protein
MRRITISALVLSLIVATAPPAAAGGWATVEPDDAAAVRPLGIATELGFRVLQHGVTPASWVTATLVAVDATSGARLEMPMQAVGADGRFVVDVTFPEPGEWRWAVTLAELGSDANGVVTVVSPEEAFAAYAVRVEHLEQQLDAALTALEEQIAKGSDGDTAATR